MKIEEVQAAVKTVLQFAIDHKLELDFDVNDHVFVPKASIVHFTDRWGHNGEAIEVTFNHRTDVLIDLHEIKSVYFNTNIRATSLKEFESFFRLNLEKSEKASFNIYFEKEDNEKSVFSIRYFYDPRLRKEGLHKQNVD